MSAPHVVRSHGAAHDGDIRNDALWRQKISWHDNNNNISWHVRVFIFAGNNNNNSWNNR